MVVFDIFSQLHQARLVDSLMQGVIFNEVIVAQHLEAHHAD